MTILPNDLQIQYNPYKNFNCLFAEIDKLMEIHMEIEGTQIVKKIFEKKVGGLIFSNFKTDYKTTVIKIVWY